jgi:RNA polymerase sigma factor (sigma-70 family)
MILRVCRQILGNQHDADDAFQATFLVLIHNAKSVRKRDSVSCWLYGIAQRVSRRSRSDAIRRRSHEQRWASSLKAEGLDPPTELDFYPELLDELGRLPEKYRESVVLCYLEGLSIDAAARRLGCAQGTVLSRLSRARDRLRKRLTRRGLVLPAALAALGSGVRASTAAVPASLIQSLEDAAYRLLADQNLPGCTTSSGTAKLAQGVLRTMFLTRLKMVGAVFVALAAATAGAGFLIMPTVEPGPEALQAARASDPRKAISNEPRKAPDLRGSSAVPGDLIWTEVPAGEWLDVLDKLAARSRSNYEKIKTWNGSYSFSVRQYLNKDFVAALPVPSGKAEPLMQEFAFGETFVVETASGNIFRDKEAGSMRFVKVGTSEPFVIPDVGPGQGRSIVTADRCLEFRAHERATTAFLPDHPDAQNKRIVNCYPIREHQAMISADAPDPREFFKTDPGNQLWSGVELYAQALQGRHGTEQFKEAARRLTISAADGPGGRWYWEQTRLNGPDASKDLFSTTVWSPQAGYNPVLHFLSWNQPDGLRESMSEWHWKLVDGVQIPSRFTSVSYHAPDGGVSNERSAMLKDCVLNRPLAPHQFDYQGLGAADGDVIVSYIERVVYSIRGGKPVKLGNFVR